MVLGAILESNGEKVGVTVLFDLVGCVRVPCGVVDDCLVPCGTGTPVVVPCGNVEGAGVPWDVVVVGSVCTGRECVVRVCTRMVLPGSCGVVLVPWWSFNTVVLAGLEEGAVLRRSRVEPVGGGVVLGMMVEGLFQPPMELDL